jgi:hypothetical protein
MTQSRRQVRKERIVSEDKRLVELQADLEPGRRSRSLAFAASESKSKTTSENHLEEALTTAEVDAATTVVPAAVAAAARMPTTSCECGRGNE